MIAVDQLGYFPKGFKFAIATSESKFSVIDTKTQKSVFEGTSSFAHKDSASGDEACLLDFTALESEGEYFILAGNGQRSSAFRIGNDIYKHLQYDVTRCLYYQRCGMPLEEKHAGIFARPVCHTENAILYSDYVKKTADPQKFDMSGGWHDAGDYGRYTSAGAVAVGHLLYAFELFPESFNESLNIPESGNGIPDVLNECYYELKWLLKMQSPNGGVYHKLTSFRHAEFIMPEEDDSQFLIFPVSSIATADFTAVMALAARVYKPFMPEFADEALEAASKSAHWLRENQYIGFTNPDGCDTGEYGDDSDLDERLWAVAEMYRTDIAHRDLHLDYLTAACQEYHTHTDFGWEDVSGFASLALLTDPKHPAGLLESNLKNKVLLEASRVANLLKTSGYLVGMENKDFVWGSNMVVLNRAILFVLASRLTEGSQSDRYKACAIEHIHYIMGRNPMDISYVTGFGEKAYMHPHHRVTEKDNIKEPMPGWVSGGPFRFFCDAAAEAVIPKGTPPMKCYLDDVGSYSTNEVTIYWNSPLVFVLAFLNSLYA